MGKVKAQEILTEAIQSHSQFRTGDALSGMEGTILITGQQMMVHSPAQGLLCPGGGRGPSVNSAKDCPPSIWSPVLRAYWTGSELTAPG